MTPRPPSSRALTPWLLAGPGALFFAGMILLPLALTVILSFRAYDHATGIKDTYTLAHYIAVVTDEYYLGIFWRTLRIAALTTLICAIIGAPEAYILARMRNPWRSVFLLVIIGPLLVSVVVRAFGWSMLLGSQGLVNQALQLVGLPSARLLYTETAIVIALVHVMLPFMVIPIWTALQKLDPMVEAAAWTLGASRFAALRRVVMPQVIARHAVRLPHRVRPLGQRLRDSRPARRPQAQDGGDARLRRISARAELAARRRHRDHRSRRQPAHHAGL